MDESTEQDTSKTNFTKLTYISDDQLDEVTGGAGGQTASTQSSGSRSTKKNQQSIFNQAVAATSPPLLSQTSAAPGHGSASHVSPAPHINPTPSSSGGSHSATSPISHNSGPAFGPNTHNSSTHGGIPLNPQHQVTPQHAPNDFGRSGNTHLTPGTSSGHVAPMGRPSGNSNLDHGAGTGHGSTWEHNQHQSYDSHHNAGDTGVRHDVPETHHSPQEFGKGQSPGGNQYNHQSGPAVHPLSPGSQISNHQQSIEAVTRHQAVWNKTVETNPGLFSRLKNVYRSVMGTPVKPSHYGDASSLPPHLQQVLKDNHGDYQAALKTKLGDLDRELLRSTFDKNYNRQPLMGYKSYDGFMHMHGQDANYHQIQKLSPADRLRYISQYGKQSADETVAAQARIQQISLDQHNMRQSTQLDEVRSQMQKQIAISSAHYSQSLHDHIDRVNHDVNDGEDDF